MITRFPKDLPRLLAAIAGSSLLAWGFASLWAETAIGRPSSTAGLAYVFLPAWAALIAAGAYIFGWKIRSLLETAGTQLHSPLAYRAGASLALLLLPSAAAMQGVSTVRRAEADARPRVLISNPRVVRELARSTSLIEYRSADLVWDFDGARAPATLAEGIPHLRLTGRSASFALGNRQSPSIDLRRLDYVTSAYLLALKRGAGEHAFVAVLNGRPTGRRALALVLSTDLRVLHAELLERSWPLRENPLVALPSNSEAGEIAFVGGLRQPVIALRVN